MRISYNVHGQLNCEGGFHFRKEVVDVSTYETLSKLMDRRLRRGLGTCIISDVPWIAFTYQDRFKVIRNLEGNGTFKSINVMEYAKREV